MWGFTRVGPLLAVAVGLDFLFRELPLPLPLTFPLALAGLRFRLFPGLLVFAVTGNVGINKSVGAGLTPGSGTASGENRGGVALLSAIGRATRPAVDRVAVTATIVVIRECFGTSGTVFGGNWGIAVVGGTRGVAWVPAWDGESTIVFVFFGETAGPAIGPGVNKPIETEAVYAKGATEDHAKVGKTHFIDVGGVADGGEMREEVVEEVVVLGE